MAKSNKGAQPKKDEQLKSVVSTENVILNPDNSLQEEGAQPKKDEQAPAGDHLSEGVTKIMTIGEQADGHNMVISSVGFVTETTAPVDLHPGLVKVLIEYPADWNKQRFFNDGEEKFMSQESADQFVELGIATIVKE